LEHFRARLALGDKQRGAQGGLHDQFLLGTLGGVWQVGEQLQPLREVRYRFLIGRPLNGLLARPLPVANRLRTEARLCVMMRYQFRLSLSNLGKLRRQHLCNALMVLLACALQERLIGGIVDEGVLEEVPVARRPTALVVQFGIH
jgi:hypothetical protein